MTKKTGSRGSAREGKARVRGAGKVAQKAAGKPAKGGTALRPLRKSPLSKSQLAEFRRMLLEKRRSIIGDLNGIEAASLRTNRQEGAGDLSNMPTHPADVGSDTFEHEFSLGLLESERALLSEIDQALERIDKGAYGICLGTGKPIDLARLKARPWAKYCIEYARLIEKGLVRPGEEIARSAEDEEPEEGEAEGAEPEEPAEASDEGEVEEEPLPEPDESEE